MPVISEMHNAQSRPYLLHVRCCYRGVSSHLWAAAGDSAQKTEPAGWQYWPQGAEGAGVPLDGGWAGLEWHGRERGAEPGAAAAEAHTIKLIRA